MAIVNMRPPRVYSRLPLALWRHVGPDLLSWRGLHKCQRVKARLREGVGLDGTGFETNADHRWHPPIGSPVFREVALKMLDEVDTLGMHRACIAPA